MMRAHRRLLLCLTIMLMSGSAYAEGGSCPDGYYPIGGGTGGWVGCAPIPGAGGEGESSPPPVTGPEWRTSWGAIAIDGSVGAVGSVTGDVNKRRAERNAIKACRERGGTSACHVTISYYNQCGAFAAGDSGAISASSETVEKASDLALKNCSGFSSNCAVVQADCSYPVQVR